MNKPAVTVLMPVKEFHAGLLATAVGSIIAQDRPDWRLLIVVEPGREDLSQALGAAVRDARISIIRNEGRKLAGAFNTGMRRAATEFTAILLADDMWLPDAVGVLTRYMRMYPSADFFHSSRIIVDEHDKPISKVYMSPDAVHLADFETSSPVKHLLCWRVTTALRFGGMDETLNSVGPDDFDFPWTMAEHGAVFVPVKECLYAYRDHRECYRLTTHLPLSIHEREVRRIMKKHGASAWAIEQRIAESRRAHLRQCLYRSVLDKWIKERRGCDPRSGWRETYK